MIVKQKKKTRMRLIVPSDLSMLSRRFAAPNEKNMGLKTVTPSIWSLNLGIVNCFLLRSTMATLSSILVLKKMVTRSFAL